MRECYNTSLRTATKPTAPMAMVVDEGANPSELDPRVIEKPKAELVEEVEEVTVVDEPLRKLKVGKNLADDMKEKLVEFLKANLDVFAWSHEDMVGIDPAVIFHHQNIDPKARSVRQKRRALDKWVHPGDILPTMGIKPSASPEAQRKMEDLCGLY